MRTVEFTCRKCGGHRIEEVMHSVTVRSPITKIFIQDDTADCNYNLNLVSHEDGYVDHYQCIDCGRVIEANDLVELVEALDNLLEQKRRDEKRGLYPEHINDAN
jgi:hypothetical protein